MVPYEKLSQDRQHDVGDFQEWDHRLGLFNTREIIPGWWFQTFFIFHNIWDVILPID